MSFWILFALALTFWLLAGGLIGSIVGAVIRHGTEDYDEDYLGRDRL